MNIWIRLFSRNNDTVHDSEFTKHLPGENVLSQWSRARPADPGDISEARSIEKEKNSRRVEEGKKGGENVGHYHGSFRRVLVTIFRYRHNATGVRALHGVHHQRVRHSVFPVARVRLSNFISFRKYCSIDRFFFCHKSVGASRIASATMNRGVAVLQRGI